MNVGTICQRNVVTVAATESLPAAARLMREKHVGFLVVVDRPQDETYRTVSGVLTDRDIVVAVVAREVDPRSLTVGDVMARDPLLVAESASIESALRHMREYGVRRVPVVGASGYLTGVLSVDDALDALADQLSSIAGAIGNEQRVERVVRT